jgi:hypothetical protein
LGFHEEERAYDMVVAHQTLEKPVFGDIPRLNAPPVATAEHLKAQGFDDGWEFWTAVEALFPRRIQPGPQDVGNCVGYSCVLSAIDGMCEEVYWGDEPEAPFIPLVWFSYGAGRVYIGNNRLGRSHGSTGAWQIAADVQYGFLPHDTSGLSVKASERCEPPARDYQAWSWTQAILDEWAPKAAPYRLGTSSRLSSADEVLEVVTESKRPLTIASNQGFRKQGYDQRYGITLWTFGGSWSHMMHIRAVVQIKGNWFVYVGNQWGVDYHGDPGKGPRGGFWIPMELMARWAPRAVIYARGKFAGRLPKKPDFSVV